MYGLIKKIAAGALVLQAMLAASPVPAAAQSQAGVPGVVTEGSSNTTIGGQPAARNRDATDSGGAIAGGSKDVFINGRPAATVGDRTDCGGITVGGAGNVFINGKPAARAGDLTTECPPSR